MVMQVTMAGAQPHWNLLFLRQTFTWANDYAEGFITDVVIPAELLHSSRTSQVRRSGPDVRMTLRQCSGLLAARYRALHFGSASADVANDHSPVFTACPSQGEKVAPGSISTMSKGILYDATLCIGCKMCEKACAEHHGLPYDDNIAAEHKQSDHKYTVVLTQNDKFMRRLCMNCQDPTCASVCPVSALRKTALGPGHLRSLTLHWMPLLHDGLSILRPQVRVGQSSYPLSASAICAPTGCLVDFPRPVQKLVLPVQRNSVSAMT